MKCKLINKAIYLASAFLIAAFISHAFLSDACAGVMIISNKSTPIDTLSKGEIRDIFLGEQIKWPDGEQIVVVILQNTDAHDEFTKKYTRKTPSQFTSYWKSMVFTGKGTVPKKFATEKEVIAYVASTKGAIGYISSGTKPDNVKVIDVSDI